MNVIPFAEEVFFISVVALFILIILIVFSRIKHVREELSSKIYSNKYISYTDEECSYYQEIADAVLNNSTITFHKNDDEDPDHQLYSKTILLGGNILRSEMFNISDTGEV